MKFNYIFCVLFISLSKFSFANYDLKKILPKLQKRAKQFKKVETNTEFGKHKKFIFELNNPPVYEKDGWFFDGIRIKTPSLEGYDLVWFAIINREVKWRSILSVKGKLLENKGYFPLYRDYKNLKINGVENFGIAESVTSNRLLPDKEYIIWFATKTKIKHNVTLGLNFIKGHDSYWYRNDVLNALGIKKKEKVILKGKNYNSKNSDNSFNLSVNLQASAGKRKRHYIKLNDGITKFKTSAIFKKELGNKKYFPYYQIKLHNHDLKKFVLIHLNKSKEDNTFWSQIKFKYDYSRRYKKFWLDHNINANNVHDFILDWSEGKTVSFIVDDEIVKKFPLRFKPKSISIYAGAGEFTFDNLELTSN